VINNNEALLLLLGGLTLLESAGIMFGRWFSQLFQKPNTLVDLELLHESIKRILLESSTAQARQLKPTEISAGVERQLKPTEISPGVEKPSAPPAHPSVDQKKPPITRTWKFAQNGWKVGLSLIVLWVLSVIFRDPVQKTWTEFNTKTFDTKKQHQLSQSDHLPTDADRDPRDKVLSFHDHSVFL
jgi:hypothetical protein